MNLLLRRRAMMMQQSRLPYDYQKVEYLEATDFQYIRTGVFKSSTDRLWRIVAKVSFSNVSGRRLHGADGLSNFGVANGYVQISQTSASGDMPTEPLLNVEPNTKIVYDLTFDAQHQMVTGTVNDTQYSFTRSMLVSNQEFSIFRSSNNEAVQTIGKVFSYDIYTRNVLSRKLIPCYRKSDNVAGMYDLANSGKNLFDGEWLTGIYSTATGVYNPLLNRVCTKNFIKVKPSTNYIFSFNGANIPNSAMRIIFYDATGNYIGSVSNVFQFKTPANCYNVNMYLAENHTVDEEIKMMVEKGTVATTYEPYPFYTNAGTGDFIVGPDIT